MNNTEKLGDICGAIQHLDYTLSCIGTILTIIMIAIIVIGGLQFVKK